MGYTEQWKQAKERYEKGVKDKKPSQKFLGFFNKPTGIEPACKDLDAAFAKKNRADAEKALAKLKQVGEAYVATLEKMVETELPAIKQGRANILKDMLKDILHDAHNEVKGLDEGVFDQVLGPEILAAVQNVKFAKDAHVKSFATVADYTMSYATNAKSNELGKFQTIYKTKFQVCLSALKTFNDCRGKTMPKAQALKVAKVTLDEMSASLGHDGMLGQFAFWMNEQMNGLKALPEKKAQFLKSVFHQAISAAGQALNDDVVALSKAFDSANKIKL